MLKFDRHMLILDALEKEGTVSLSHLMKITETPRLSIQRDLKELETKQKLKRVHGGAILVDSAHRGLPKKIREHEKVAVKKALCKCALQFIHKNDTICIDASTTCSYLLTYMPDIPLNVITPALESFRDLACKQNVTAVLSGGIMNKDTQNLVGSLTIDVIKKFSYSTCFISADGFDCNRGSLELDCEESMVKKSMIDVSEQVIVLIDSSKLSNTKGIVTCPVEKITRIITNKSMNISWPEEFNNIVIFA